MIRVAMLALALWFSWTGLILEPAIAASSSGQALKILTFNFNSEIVAFDDRDNKIRDVRFEALVEWIRSHDPDVILLQEGWNFHRDPSVAIRLARTIGYDYYYRLDEGFPGLLYDSNIILAKKSLHMEQAHALTLPHSAPFIGDSIHYIIPLGIITKAVGAKLTLANGKPLFVYTTHLLGGSESRRRDQLAAVDGAIKKQAARNKVSWEEAQAIIAGDFNAAPEGTDVGLLTTLGYTDTWAVAHPDHSLDDLGTTNCSDPYSPRFNPYTLGAGELPAQADLSPDQRIDYIWARGRDIKVLASTQIFTHQIRGIWMSDHYAVYSTLFIGDEGTTSPTVPNPLDDSDEAPPNPSSRVLELTDAQLDLCNKQIDCSVDLPLQNVDSHRGLAVVNRTSDRIFVKIKGPARVLPARKVTLSPGQTAAFTFFDSGSYHGEIIDGVGDIFRAPISVHLP